MIHRSDFTMPVTGTRQPASSEETRSFKVQCSGFNVSDAFRPLNLELLNCSSLLGHQRAQNHANEAEHDGAEESGPKAGNEKTRYEV